MYVVSTQRLTLFIVKALFMTVNTEITQFIVKALLMTVKTEINMVHHHSTFYDFSPQNDEYVVYRD